MARRAFVIAVLVVSVAIALSATTADAVDRAKVRTPGPTRVLLVGDSFTVFYGDNVAARLSGYKTINMGGFGAGLLDATRCDGSFARSLVTQYDPDVVVVEYTGNYAYPGDACHRNVARGSKLFYQEWKKAAAANQHAYRSRGARLFWILPPMPLLSPYDVEVPQLNGIYQAIAPKHGTIDTWTPFGGWTYNPLLHNADGLHPNGPGADMIARLIATRVRG